MIKMLIDFWLVYFIPLCWICTTIQASHISDNSASLVIPHSAGGLVVGLGRSLALVDWDTKQVTKLASFETKGTNDRFNDGKCDASGRLWAGKCFSLEVLKIMKCGRCVLSAISVHVILFMFWRLMPFLANEYCRLYYFSACMQMLKACAQRDQSIEDSLCVITR